ncbi:MAG: hypothetical protein J7K36_09035 [Archaeoglobaceae archaeon]|nr:hypothetical protein [Archaeoglobaceae archaeon]
MRIKDLAEQLADIKEHVEVINEELGDLTIRVTAISTDLRWIKYFVGLSMVLALASLGVKIIQL